MIAFERAIKENEFPFVWKIVDAIFQQQLEPIPLLPMLYVKAYISYILYQDVKR